MASIFERKAAVTIQEFITGWYGYYTPGQGMGNPVSMPWKVFEAVEKLVGYALKENKEDDEESLTIGWLNEFFTKIRKDEWDIKGSSLHIECDWTVKRKPKYHRIPTFHVVFEDGDDWVTVFKPRTRGELREYFRVMHIAFHN